MSNDFFWHFPHLSSNAEKWNLISTITKTENSQTITQYGKREITERFHVSSVNKNNELEECTVLHGGEACNQGVGWSPGNPGNPSIDCQLQFYGCVTPPTAPASL